MKALTLLPGAIALFLSLVPVVPIFTSTAIADTVQASPDNALTKLNLSNDQKAKLKQIRDEANQKIGGILDSKQKAQIQEAQKSGKKVNLNLTNDQKEAFKKVFVNANKQIGDILTPDQRKKLQEMQAAAKNKK